VSSLLIFWFLIHSPVYSWEYPGKQGIGCNVLSSNDSANFLLFLQTLRCQEGAQKLIVSAAVADVPFVGPNGTPMTNVSAFEEVLDYIGTLPPLCLSHLV
jgi:chitinase